MGSKANRGGEGVRYRSGGEPMSLLKDLEGMAGLVDCLNARGAGGGHPAPRPAGVFEEYKEDR